MDLRRTLRILLRRWWIVVIPLAVVALYLVATYQRPPTVYQVVMRFAAGTTPAGLSEDYDRYYPWLASEYVANGLADAAETGLFAQNVAERLNTSGRPITAPQVQGALVTDNAQSILVIYVTMADAELCKAVAGGVAAELTENGAAYYPQLQGIGPALRLLDSATPHPLPLGLRSQLLGPAIRLALAAVAGVGLAILWHAIDPIVRRPRDICELQIAVLASIPSQRPWRRRKNRRQRNDAQ
jgi:capsular polysaccharide biosynthesis protein